MKYKLIDEQKVSNDIRPYTKEELVIFIQELIKNERQSASSKYEYRCWAKNRIEKFQVSCPVKNSISEEELIRWCNYFDYQVVKVGETEGQLPVLLLEQSDLSSYNNDMSEIQVDKQIFDYFVPNSLVGISFVDGDTPDLICFYQMITENANTITMVSIA